MRTKEFALRYALKTESNSWGASPVTLGADDGAILEELKLEHGTATYEDTSKNGTLLNNGIEVSGVSPTFTGSCKYYTSGLNPIIQNVFTANQSGTGRELYAVSPTGSEGSFLKLGVEYGDFEQRMNFASVQNLKIAGSAKEPLSFEFDGVGREIVRDSGKTEFANVTTATGSYESLFHFYHITDFEIDGTPVKASSFDLSIAKGQISDNATTQSGKFNEEPLDGGELQVNLNVDVFTHSGDSWQSDFESESVHTAKITFSRGSSTISLFIPAMQITTDTSVDTSGAGKESLSFKAVTYSGDPLNLDSDIDFSLSEQYPVYMISE